MSNIDGATDESLPPGVENVPTSDSTPMSARDAARALSQYRWKRDTQEEKPAAAPPVAAEPAEIPPAEAEEPAAPPQEDTGDRQPEAIEQQAPAEEAAPAPLELPRSWSKDRAEQWKELNPDLQSYLLERDSQNSKAVRQAQNEAAEHRKGLDTERTALEDARKQTEQLNTQLLERFNQTIMGEFSDIRTQQDVEKMAREDWPRFSLYQAKMMELQNYNQIQQQAQQRHQQEFRTQWDKFSTDEDKRFLEAAPEMQDETRASAVRNRSLSLLKDIGFTDQDLSRLWNGEVSLSLRDHRAQLLIRDAVRYREAQTAARTKSVKPVPIVQRPGSPAARAPDADIQNKRLEQQFDKTTHWKDAAELLIHRRSQQER